MANFKLTDAEFDEQFRRATEEGKRRDATEPRAASARYEPAARRVVVELTNGALFAFPADRVQGLAGASDEALEAVEVAPGGRGLHWETLDADYSVPALLAGAFGSRAWMAELGRRGGSASTEAKREAARANGAKGGRPKKRTASGG